MSLHDKPRYNHEALRDALEKHGLPVDTPSQNADSFRLGWTAAIDAVRALDRSHTWTETPEHTKCPHCGAPVLPQTACGVCDTLRPIGQRRSHP